MLLISSSENLPLTNTTDKYRSKRFVLHQLPKIRCRTLQRERRLNSTRQTCHLGGLQSKYSPGPMLLDFSDQMSTGMSNVARRCQCDGHFFVFIAAQVVLQGMSNARDIIISDSYMAHQILRINKVVPNLR
jgi:hypothetical protein